MPRAGTQGGLGCPKKALIVPRSICLAVLIIGLKGEEFYHG